MKAGLHTRSVKCLGFVLAAVIGLQKAQGQNPPMLQLDYEYGYAPVVMQATRAIQTAVPDTTTTPGRAPINQFGNLDSLLTPADRFIVHPNADTLYTTAWLDLSDE